MGATGGVEPSEEERMEVKEEKAEGKLDKLNMPEKFSKLFSTTLDSNIKENAVTYKEALRDIFERTSAPDRVEQIVREGFLQTSESSPRNVVLFAEGIPSWLPLIDGWGADRLFLHNEHNPELFRNNFIVYISYSNWIGQGKLETRTKQDSHHLKV